jgi:predicted ATPase
MCQMQELRVPLNAVTIKGYRSVRSLFLPVEACSVFIGANGVGKTNLYKALGLLRCAADGSITRAIPEEGGIESVLWAGVRRRGQPVRLVLKAHLDEAEYGLSLGLPHSYVIEIGLRQPTEAAFPLEPLVKEERLIIRHGRRDIVMMERKGS